VWADKAISPRKSGARQAPQYRFLLPVDNLETQEFQPTATPRPTPRRTRRRHFQMVGKRSISAGDHQAHPLKSQGQTSLDGPVAFSEMEPFCKHALHCPKPCRFAWRHDMGRCFRPA